MEFLQTGNTHRTRKGRLKEEDTKQCEISTAQNKETITKNAFNRTVQAMRSFSTSKHTKDYQEKKKERWGGGGWGGGGGKEKEEKKNNAKQCGICSDQSYRQIIV